jgi:ABC-type antimicrobial peptide transport system permease subunit
LADPARWTAVIGSFGTAAALLAALGVFGLMSYVVRQRRREIGVRLALGAEPSSVTRLIVRRGMRHAVLGLVLGLGLSLLEARWLGALLFDVPALDPLTIAAASLLLMATALVACLVPALRAARIRPLEVLASE